MRRALRSLRIIVLLALLGACRPVPAEDRRDVVLVPDVSLSAMKLRASFHYGAGYSAPVEALTIRGKPGRIWPAALIVAGCAHSEVGADFPKGVLQLSVDEDPAAAAAPTLAEACRSRDPDQIRAAVRARLDYMLASLHRIDVVDPDRLVIFASGEAAPVAAAYAAQVRGKVLLGDPCLVAWPKALDATTPTTLLRGREVLGLRWDDVAPPTVVTPQADSPSAIGRAISVSVAYCTGQRRPPFPSNYYVVERSGRVETLRRPAGLSEAGRDFMAELLAR